VRNKFVDLLSRILFAHRTPESLLSALASTQVVQLFDSAFRSGRPPGLATVQRGGVSLFLGQSDPAKKCII
jgi:hypothetical protein